MNSLQSAFLKSFSPRITLSVKSVGQRETDQDSVFNLCHNILDKKYHIISDLQTGTIYIGKRI